MTERSSRSGLILGITAILLWSFGSSLIYLGAREVGPWAFSTIAAFIGGSALLVFRKIMHGEIRTAVLLPPRLWAITLSCFVVYGLVLPWALSASTPSQVYGVNLINYLWPTLTVVCGVLWVPNTRFNIYVVIALVLSLTGLVFANKSQITELLAATNSVGGLSLKHVLPYLLASIAAITWAAYSSLLARWRSWAREYLTCGIGFILISFIAALTGVLTGGFSRLTLSGILITAVYGLGPLAGGYLMWELALTRARVQTLGLLGAATPILSVLILCLFLHTPPTRELLLATAFISGGVVLSMRS